MLFETGAQISAAREKGPHILQLYSRLNSDTDALLFAATQEYFQSPLSLS